MKPIESYKSVSHKAIISEISVQGKTLTFNKILREKTSNIGKAKTCVIQSYLVYVILII